MYCYDADDDHDGYGGGEKTGGKNLNWKIPTASLVIPGSEKGEHHFQQTLSPDKFF